MREVPRRVLTSDARYVGLDRTTAPQATDPADTPARNAADSSFRHKGGAACHAVQVDAKVVLDQAVVTPADVRAALGMLTGDGLHLRVEDEGGVQEPPHGAAAELRGLARTGPGRSLLEELLAERRKEAAGS